MSHPQVQFPTADSSRFQFEALPRARTIRFARGLSMPLQLQASLQFSDRESPSGALGVMDGAVVLSGLSAALHFSRGTGARGRGERGTAIERSLIPAGEWFAISEARFRAPIGERSPILIQIRDSVSTPLTETISLGLFGERDLSFSVSFCAPVAVLGEIASEDAGLGLESQSIIEGKLVFPRGLVARCTYRPAGHSSEKGPVMAGSADAVVVGDGQEIRFGSPLKLNPPPAIPLTSVNFVDGYGYRFGAADPAVLRGLRPNGHAKS